MILDRCIIRIIDTRSPGRKYPYWMYVIQCRHGGCTWWSQNRKMRQAENEFLWHEDERHDNMQ